MGSEEIAATVAIRQQADHGEVCLLSERTGKPFDKSHKPVGKRPFVLRCNASDPGVKSTVSVQL